MAAKQLAIVVGAGPGTGAAVGRAFAKKGFSVALLARNRDSLKSLADAIKADGGTASPFSCDVTSRESIDKAFADIKKEYPSSDLKVAVFNSSSPFQIVPFLEAKVSDLQTAYNVSVMGAFHFSQVALPELLRHQTGGSLLFTGATAALRGSAKMGTFASGKFALRGLAQSLAREFGPQGVHVAHLIVDGLIDTEKVQGMMGQAKEPGSRLNPDSIASAYVYLHEQDPSAWTQELDLRPAKEKF